MSVVTFDARANPVSIDEQIVHVHANDRLNAAAVFPGTVRQDNVSLYVQELSLRVQAPIGPVVDLGDA